jgi:phenylacetic acid degradation operon negative regulatory protein
MADRWLSGGRRAHADRDAFVDHLVLVDHWREIPYLDPGLPSALMPPDWPGSRAVALFADLQRALAPAAVRHVANVIRA